MFQKPIVTVKPVLGQDLIGHDTDIYGEVARQVASLQDQIVRNQLIAAGWTPPETKTAEAQGSKKTLEGRELLELAAKAAGRTAEGFSPTKGLLVSLRDGVSAWWNPLTTDGDSARMEAALGIHVTWHSDGVVCGKRIWQETEMFDAHGGDKQAARRMASLRVAAGMGKDLP